MKSTRACVLTALLLAPLADLHAADASASGRSFRPVELMHPREGWELTDVSAAFRWKTQCDEKSGWHVVTYQLQVANEPGFERPFWDRGIEAPHGVTEKNYWYWRQFSWQPEEFLPAGNWFWRVRVADEAGGPWSEPAGFRVNAEHKLTAPVRELSAKHPLFVFNMYKMPPIFWNQKFITGIASGASVLVFGGESSVTEVGVYDAATDRFTGHAGVGADYTAVWDGCGHKTPVLDRYVIPFLRAAVTQKLIPDKTEVLQMTRLTVAPGAPGEDHGLTTDYGRYAPLYRATYGMRDYVTLNPSTNPCAFSLPLDGATGRFVRIEKAGSWRGSIQLALAEVSVTSDGRNIAPTGVATQSSVLFGGEARRAIDGNADGRWQSGSVSTTKEEPKPWWELDLGSPRPLQSIQVFARNERGNYGRADIHSGSGWRVSLLDDQRRVVWSGAPVEKPGTRSSLGAEYEVLPNNGRYHFIPVLPHGVSPLSGIASVRLNELDTEAAVKTRFDPAYPDRSTGSAWVCEAGERVFVMNNHENCNDAQDYAVGFADGRILRRLSGTALPHWYLMGRWTDLGRQFWFQANANHKGPYTDGRQTRVVLECENEPSVITSPPQALVSRTWNGPRNELTLVLSHNQGAVEVTLHSP